MILPLQMNRASSFVLRRALRAGGPRSAAVFSLGKNASSSSAAVHRTMGRRCQTSLASTSSEDVSATSKSTSDVSATPCSSATPGSASSKTASSTRAQSNALAVEEPSTEDLHMDALLSATVNRPSNAFKPKAQDLTDLDANPHLAFMFDKVLLLVRHGETARSASTTIDHHHLSSEGYQQALKLARDSEDLLMAPELVVCAPTSASVHTTLLAFPPSSPHCQQSASVDRILRSDDMFSSPFYMCHPSLSDASTKASTHNTGEDLNQSLERLQWDLAGVDTSLCDDSTSPRNKATTTLLESKEELLQQADNFVEWLKQRPERVIVVSSESTWLQAFCLVTMEYDGSSQTFEHGEMRTVGVMF